MRTPDITVGGLVILLVLVGLGMVSPVLAWLTPQKAVQGMLRKAGLALAGFMFANLHLWVFDRMYLARGRLARLLRLPGEG